MSTAQSSILTVTDETFGQELLNTPLPVLAKFWAPWCGPCQALGPTLEELATEWQDKLKIIQLNVDENRATVNHFGIQGVPTMLLFKDGEALDRITGNQSKEILLQKLQSYLD